MMTSAASGSRIGIAERRPGERGDHRDRRQHVALRVSRIGEQQLARQAARRPPFGADDGDVDRPA